MSTNELLADPENLWRALTSRDARFDGRFFAGVTSTGIYCRPVCPARTPLRSNVRFFACAAAAEEAGFRPCRRCRPETAPRSPAWSGTSTTVLRALSLIENGAIDGAGVDALADRLGVGARHLRRLFLEHVGASPLSIAKTRRVHFARTLLDATNLSVTDVADAAGFSSLRRFQSAFQETFGMPASAVRRAASGVSTLPEDALTLRLPVKQPYDWEATLTFLAARTIPGVERVDGLTWSRAFALEGAPSVVTATPDVNGTTLVVRFDRPIVRELPRVLDRIRRVFDLGANPHLIVGHLERHQLLRDRVRRRPGLRLPLTWDPFEAGVRAIVGQQVSVAGARTVLGRVVDRSGLKLGKALAKKYGLTHVFPSARNVAQADFTGVGMPGARVKTLQTVAHLIAEGQLDLDHSSPEEVQQNLLAVRGVGPWTAQYIRMRGLGDPDVMLAGDLGVRRALQLEGGELPPIQEVEALAAPWSPWRSYAVLHLWQGEVSET